MTMATTDQNSRPRLFGIATGTMTAVRAAAAAVLFFILSLPAASVAASRTWTGGGAPSDLWSNPANWEPNIVPVDGDDLVFPAGSGTTTTNDLPNLLVRSLSISSAHTFSGAGIRLQNGIIMSGVGFTNPTLDLPLQLVATQTWTVSGGTLKTTANGTIDLVNARLALDFPFSQTADLTGIISGSGRSDDALWHTALARREHIPGVGGVQ
jgi:hypothetical protein